MHTLDSLTGVSSLDAAQAPCRNYTRNLLSESKVKVSHQKSVLSDVFFFLRGKSIQHNGVKSHKGIK
jgi:hypothetical protein